ncbi:MAG: carboxypeptidase regulatory-like domain-containing protein [Bryobacteraceae bacterium]|nr:carboxypeptidase regulatory-like domain-containing protein [Bryobacteraceae bacterium]
MLPRYLERLLLFFVFVFSAEAAHLSGVVYDGRGTPLFGAEVQVQSESSGARWKLLTDEQGRYSLPAVPPGPYRVRVRMPGFHTVSRSAALPSADKDLQLDFALEMIVLREVITVVSGRDELDPSGSGALILARESTGSGLPANGRDFRAAFDLMPGVVITPAGVNDAGQFSSNGQRPNSGTFRVDGASANTGVGGNALPGAFPGASLPAMTAFGTTENLVTPENTQSVEFRPLSFAPEAGGRPGPQTIITTRSGSNQFHGSFFGRLRDHGWNARDWFYNSEPVAYTQIFHAQQPNQYRATGGTFGGPIFPNRTYFFFSFDRSSLADSSYQRTSVPSMRLRQEAPPELGGILTFFPQPTGRELGGGESEGVIPITTNGSLKTYSLRADHSYGSHAHLSGRFVQSQSSLLGSYGGGTSNWRSLTIGLTTGFSGQIHDLRFSYSNATAVGFHGGARTPLFGLSGLMPGFRIERYGPDSWGWVQDALAEPNLAKFLPPVPSVTVLGISVRGLGQFIEGYAGQARQQQWEIAHSVSRQSGRHYVRGGVQAVRLDPARDVAVNSARGAASGLDSILDGSPIAVTLSQVPRYAGRVYAVSAFLQDTVKLSDSLNLLYGLRWELTPPTSGQQPVPTVSGMWTANGWQTAYEGDVNRNAPWPMRFGQVAPRAGLAYRVPGASGLVFRAGAGLFLDTALGASVNPINGAPFNSWQLSSSGTGIGTSALPSPDWLPLADSPEIRQFLSGPYPALRLPASWQWQTSLEREAGAKGVASLAYTGSMGRNLVGNHAYVEPDTGVLKRIVTLTRDASSYHALQLRYSGMVTPALQASASYTWSHSIDNSSQDSNVFLVRPGYSTDAARGSSSFDVRHALTAAVSYQTPARMPKPLRSWLVSGILRARTGFPIDIRNSEPAFGLSFINAGRPDRIPDAPVWIRDSAVAGGRRLNPAAFHMPAAGQEGSLGRNVIAGNGLAQIDMSLRRHFHLFRGMALQVEINVFNVANHPAFADPVPFLSSHWFGQSTSMQNLMLGSGRPNSGLPSVFLPGGSRSVELGFRFSF